MNQRRAMLGLAGGTDDHCLAVGAGPVFGSETGQRALGQDSAHFEGDGRQVVQLFGRSGPLACVGILENGASHDMANRCRCILSAFAEGLPLDDVDLTNAWDGWVFHVYLH